MRTTFIGFSYLGRMTVRARDCSHQAAIWDEARRPGRNRVEKRCGRTVRSAVANAFFIRRRDIPIPAEQSFQCIHFIGNNLAGCLGIHRCVTKTVLRLLDRSVGGVGGRVRCLRRLVLIGRTRGAKQAKSQEGQDRFHWRNLRASRSDDKITVSASYSTAKTVDPSRALNYVGRSDAPIAQLVEQLTFNQ